MFVWFAARMEYWFACLGWGGNKAIQTLTMAAEAYHFIALPNVFNFADDVPDAPHAPAADPDFITRVIDRLIDGLMD